MSFVVFIIELINGLVKLIRIYLCSLFLEFHHLLLELLLNIVYLTLKFLICKFLIGFISLHLLLSQTSETIITLLIYIHTLKNAWIIVPHTLILLRWNCISTDSINLLMALFINLRKFFTSFTIRSRVIVCLHFFFIG